MLEVCQNFVNIKIALLFIRQTTELEPAQSCSKSEINQVRN